MGYWLSSVEIMERLRIIIDGATGFIGANLSKYFLMKGHDVHTIIRPGSNNWRINKIRKEITAHSLDITERDATFNMIKKILPDVFIHTAAYGGYHFETDRDEIFKANLFGTTNVLDASIASNVPFLINTGSSSEYGIKNKPMKESDNINPETNYALSKALATEYCLFRNNTSTKNVTLRLFSAYGYYEESHRLIPYVLYSAIKRNKIYLNNPNNVRDYVFIEDVVSAYYSAVKMQKNITSGSIFNVGTGKQLSTKDIVKTTEKIIGYELPVSFGNVSERAGDKAKKWQAYTPKIMHKLKWHPSNDIYSGLLKTKKWMEHNIEMYEDVNNVKLNKHK